MNDERTAGDPLGLAGTFPRPGWVVIDAVRDAGFTGEVVCTTTPAVTIHADRGRIYAAERSSDAPLSARLVDAGALSAAELERGVLRLAGAEHLGRLFERVPSVDRDTVLAAAALMTEDCLSWLAAQHVGGADATPYRHHPAGIHRWDPAPESTSAETVAAPLAAPAVTLAPPVFAAPAAPVLAPPAMPAPLPAPAALLAPPAPSAFAPPASPMPAPAALAAPAMPAPVLAPPVLRADAPASLSFDLPRIEVPDDVISWDEPGFLDEPLPGDPSFGLVRPLQLAGVPTVPSAPSSRSILDDRIDLGRFGLDPAPGHDGDWIDHLDHDGLPAAGTDPLARPVALPPLHAEPADRFELIWPSGEIDEQFGGQPVDPDPHPDRDRGGPTARLRLEGRPGRAALLQPLQPPAPTATPDDAIGIGRIEEFLAEEAGRSAAPAAPGDDIVQAIRQATASIAAGSLAGERRTGPRGAVTAVPPTATGRMTRPNPTAPSVFDDLPAAAPTPPSVVPVLPPAEHEQVEEGAERVSALRRLIGSLRRH